MSGLYHQEPNMQNTPNPSQLTPGQLKALYPYQFSGPGVHRMSFARGWMPTIETMCHEVDELLHGHLAHHAFQWMGFKEKFGVGRFHYLLRALDDPLGEAPDSPETANLKAGLLAIKFKAEERTKSLCMVCGKPGELVDAPWLLTLCPAHEAVHLRRDELHAYLTDDGSEA